MNFWQRWGSNSQHFVPSKKWDAKGQLISKGLFVFFNPPKNRTKNFCPRGWCIKFATHKWPLQLTKVHFMTISSRFFANYFDIFHKTEVQTVILRWWTGLNWLKSYDTNHKYFHFNPSRKFDAPPYTNILHVFTKF